MKTTRITASYAETVTLPEYCNARPSLSIEAVLEDGEDELRAIGDLTARVQGWVFAEVDRLLEEHHQPPKHYDGPTFCVMTSDRHRKEKLLLIVPDALIDSIGFPEGFANSFHLPRRKNRLEYCRRRARERAKQWDCEVIDISADSDYSRIPALPPKEEAEPAYDDDLAF